jgi:integrase
LGQQQKRVRELLKFAADFVHHSLRHTFGTRLGEAGADAFTIMRRIELAFGRLVALNLQKVATNIGTLE